MKKSKKENKPLKKDKSKPIKKKTKKSKDNVSPHVLQSKSTNIPGTASVMDLKEKSKTRKRVKKE